MSAVLKFPERKPATDKPHALKIESLDISRKYADEIDLAIYYFLDDLGFDHDRIENVMCRSCDGFIPFSHNKGGLEAYCYRLQYNCFEDTGFENTDKTLTKYYDNDYNDFLVSEGITSDEFDGDQVLRDKFDDMRDSDDSTVQFHVRVMITSETTATVCAFVDAKDTPYHRTYDDLFEQEITFKSIAGLKQKLNRIKKKDFFKTLKKNIREGF